MDDVIIELVDATLEKIKSIDFTELYQAVPAIMLVRQHKTMRLQLPRGFGITSAAVQVLMKYPKSVLLTSNEQEKRRISQIIPSSRIFNFKEWVNGNNFTRGNSLFSDLDVLVLDTASIILNSTQNNQRTIDEMELTLFNKVKLFLYLG
jgi:hypothetical protein